MAHTNAGPPVKRGLHQRLSSFLPRRLRSTSPASQASPPPIPGLGPTPPSRSPPPPLSQSTALQPVTSLSHPQQYLLQRTLVRLSEVSKEDYATIQAHIPATIQDADGALSQALAQAQTLQQKYTDQKREITFNSHTYVVKDVITTVVRLLDRIKSVGDVVANADPVHIGLPWAGIRLLLVAATHDGNQMATLLPGCETALYMSNRLKAYTDFLARLPQTLSRNNFETGLIEFYVCLLSFLARAIRLYHTSTARRVIQSLWKDDEITRFEVKCSQLGSIVEVEASNCDRDQFERHLQQTVEGIRRLRTVQETLDRIETQVNRIATTVVQIDAVISQAYNNGRLRVERLSGASLSLENCFVNLSLVRHVRDSDEPNRNTITGQVSRFSLAPRLKVETPPESDQMSLRTLFEPRKRKDGSNVRPTRILIWGRAGMGKTTLCKKIVDEVSNHGLWKELYDRVIWLPLRRLKRAEVRDVVELIQYEFPLTGLGQQLPETLRELVQNERTLFLLDGLDEVSLALDRDCPSGRILHDLLSRSHVIVTSRPHSTRDLDHKPPDLELETIGFFPQQVEEYIRRVAAETRMTNRTAREIRTFVQSRPLVQSLARIPIQLDAICYTWRAENFSQNTVTMTNLYSTIAQSLWKDTILRLERRSEGELITKQQVEHWLHFEDFVRREIDFLQELAFRGLCEESDEFGNKDIARTEAGRKISGDRLVHISFLRASDSSVEASDRTLHFIHRTFQEFLAAQFFVRHWASGRALPFIDTAAHELGLKRPSGSVTPQDFLRFGKYIDRYNIFWRFVVGLLQTEPENTRFDDFWGVLEDKPLDLVGRTHHRLVIHCLSEIDSDKHQPVSRVRKLEEGCLQWICYASKVKREQHGLSNSRSLLWEAECSDYILQRLLFEPGTTQEVLKVLCARSRISSRLLDQVFNLLGEVGDESIRTLAIRVIGLFCGSDQKEKFQKFWHSAKCNDTDLLVVVAALQETQRLLVPAVQALVSLSHHPDVLVRSQAGYALRQQTTLPNTAVEALVSLLQDSDASVRFQAADTLGYQTTLPSTAVEALVLLLQDSDASVRNNAADALGRQTTLPNTIVEALVSLLQDSDVSVRCRAVVALGRQTTLPSMVIKALVSLLQDSDASVRNNAADALGRQTTLPNTVVEALVLLLQDSDISVRYRAVVTLRQQITLPRTAVKALVSLLQDSDVSVRYRAADALGRQTTLPSTAVEALVLLLQDPDASIRRNALNTLSTLKQQTTLPSTVAEALVSLLQDPDASIRRNALYTLSTLKQQTTLPSTVVEALVSPLQDPDVSVRYRAAGALGRQTTLPNTVVEALVSLLQDSDVLVRYQAADALRRQATLPNTAVETIVSLLQHPKAKIHPEAMSIAVSRKEVLSFFPALQSMTLQHFMRWWSQADSADLFIWEDCIYIRSSGVSLQMPLPKHQIESFESRWLEARNELGFPSLLPSSLTTVSTC